MSNTCPVCNGDGKDVWICPTCDAGTWINPDTNKPDICPECYGEGSKLITCTSCGGTGTVDD